MVIGFGKGRAAPKLPGSLYSARSNGIQGIFRSDDAGASWIRINDDQHSSATTGSTITGRPSVYGRVYIGANGRGIIQGDQPTGLTALYRRRLSMRTPYGTTSNHSPGQQRRCGYYALSVTIVIQRTAGLNYSGQYNNGGRGQILQTHSSDATTLTCQFHLAAGRRCDQGTIRVRAQRRFRNSHPDER